MIGFIEEKYTKQFKNLFIEVIGKISQVLQDI